MVDYQSLTAENRRGKEEEEERRRKKKKEKPQLQNIMDCQLLWAVIITSRMHNRNLASQWNLHISANG